MPVKDLDILALSNKTFNPDAKWNTVIKAVSATSVNLWFGSLSLFKRRPFEVCFVVTPGKKSEQQSFYSVIPQWKLPISGLDKSFYDTFSLSNLAPDTLYTVKVIVGLTAEPRKSIENYFCIDCAEFTTLPTQLSETKPFTLMAGSCFYREDDNGALGRSYEKLWNNEQLRPAVTFLCGDQVYLDLGSEFVFFDEDDLPLYLLDEYNKNWAAMASVLKRGGNWMMSDDHEFWNDYPRVHSNNLVQMCLRNDSHKTLWENLTKDSFKQIQQGQAVSQFSLGNDLAFCLFDVRINRTENTQFMASADLKKVIDWIAKLQGPGVLVTSQPLSGDPSTNGENDKAIKDYPEQYNLLMNAIDKAKFDVVFIGGDVHYGITNQVMLSSGANLVEVISSPMSNITGVSGLFAMDTADKKSHFFPARKGGGIEPKAVTTLYKSKSTKVIAGHKKTKEHFVTLSFTKKKNQIALAIKYWYLRDFAKSDTYVPDEVNCVLSSEPRLKK